MSDYNYKNCQSLFGYSAEVHIRCKGKCQLCGCGGNPLNFDLWRQMTVEHLIGKSQGGYLKQIKLAVADKFPEYSVNDISMLAKKLDALNTVTACQFCNSTTSRDVCNLSMTELINNGANEAAILSSVKNSCDQILENKKQKVAWKLKSVKEAFDKHVAPKIV